MFISLREAGDLCLQMTLALTLTVSGMVLASTVVKATEQRISVINVNRPSLWSAGPVRVENADRIPLSDGRDCHNTIGLRISCHLLTSAVSGGF